MLDAEALVLGPHLWLLYVEADPHAHERGQDAYPEHLAPPDRGTGIGEDAFEWVGLAIEESIAECREGEAETPRALEHTAHEAARARRPRFHRQRRTGRPLGAHANAEQGAEKEQEGERRREAGDEVAERVPQD